MLLCDTGVLLAAGNVKDHHHAACLALMRAAEGPAPRPVSCSRVQAITADAPRIASYTPRRDERIALADAVTLLVGLGVLSVVEAGGDYGSDQDANALYDIDDRRLGHLIAAPYPPSLASSVEHMLHESRYGPWPPPAWDTQPEADDEDGSGGGDMSGIPVLEEARALATSGMPTTTDDQLRRRTRHRMHHQLPPRPRPAMGDAN